MYIVRNTTSIYHRVEVATVATFAEAEAFLATVGEIVLFEIDPDGHDAADAAVKVPGDLALFTVEVA